MKKNYSNKELKAEETKEESFTTPVESKPVKLICIRECVVPDLGHWISGDTESRPAVVKRLGGNPNFKEMEG